MGISQATIVLTDYCNLKCSHCYASPKYFSYSKGIAYIDQIKKIIDVLKYNHINFINWTGGEPLLYPYIVEVLTYAREQGLESTIFTNGTIDLTHVLRSNLASNFVISIDGEEEVHDRIRGNKGAFQFAISNIKKIKDYNQSCSITMTVGDMNFKHINHVYRISNNLDVDKLRIIPIYSFGRGKNIAFESDQQMITLMKRLKEIYRLNNYHTPIETDVISKDYFLADFNNIFNTIFQSVWITVDEEVSYFPIGIKKENIIEDKLDVFNFNNPTFKQYKSIFEELLNVNSGYLIPYQYLHKRLLEVRDAQINL